MNSSPARIVMERGGVYKCVRLCQADATGRRWPLATALHHRRQLPAAAGGDEDGPARVRRGASGGLPTLVIDAGHGGEDGGASTAGGALESAINLAVAQKLDALARLFGVKTRC